MRTTIIVLTILISILFSNVILAGDKNELKLSYGYSGMEYLIKFIDFSSDNPDDQTFGTLCLSYSRRIHNKMSVGANVTYLPYRSYFNNSRKSRIEHSVLPFVKFDYRYIVEPKFELYSSASITYIWFLSHLTFIGCKWGSKHAFFAELGLGGGQLASAGYAFKF